MLSKRNVRTCRIWETTDNNGLRLVARNGLIRDVDIHRAVRRTS